MSNVAHDFEFYRFGIIVLPFGVRLCLTQSPSDLHSFLPKISGQKNGETNFEWWRWQACQGCKGAAAAMGREDAERSTVPQHNCWVLGFACLWGIPNVAPKGLLSFLTFHEICGTCFIRIPAPSTLTLTNIPWSMLLPSSLKACAQQSTSGLLRRLTRKESWPYQSLIAFRSQKLCCVDFKDHPSQWTVQNPVSTHLFILELWK